MENAELLTVGHGAASSAALVDLLRGANVTSVVDVRTAPGSRAHPHFGRLALERELPARRLGYRWEPQLGGFRRAAPNSPDVFWQNAAFRGYAGHLRTPEAQAALRTVLEEAEQGRTTVMCSESVWWRCHRRLIADYAVLVAGISVYHLMHDGRLEPHPPSPGARLLDGGLLVYDQFPA
jgi:uncharacterized protein (DUF488 family)